MDPIEARTARQAAKTVTTFKECGEAYVATHCAGWREKNHE